MKKRLLRILISKLNQPKVNKIRYFWYRYWIERFQDKEMNYALLDRFARAVNLIRDAHLQYQLSHVVNDYFVCDNRLYIILLFDDLQVFGQDINAVCYKNNISVEFIVDHWTGQQEMYQHLIFNSLV